MLGANERERKGIMESKGQEKGKTLFRLRGGKKTFQSHPRLKSLSINEGFQPIMVENFKVMFPVHSSINA